MLMGDCVNYMELGVFGMGLSVIGEMMMWYDDVCGLMMIVGGVLPYRFVVIDPVMRNR